MKEIDAISGHDKDAADYDRQVREYNWLGHDALFGLCFEYVRPHERLLDVGIGTGLASLSFAKLGLEIFGIDGSVEMLQVCQSKAFARDLQQFDLRQTPMPYPDCFFDHVIACGVFNFFGDLRPIFGQVARTIKLNGIFAFVTMAQDAELGAAAKRNQDYLQVSSQGINVFMHAQKYVERLLQDFGFERLKTLGFLAQSGLKESDALFYIYVARRVSRLGRDTE